MKKKDHKKYLDKLGIVFVALGSLLVLPQLVQIYSTQSAEDFSAVTYFGFVGIGFFWLWYGLEKNVKPIVYGSIVKIIFNIVIICGIILYGDLPIGFTN